MNRNQRLPTLLSILSMSIVIVATLWFTKLTELAEGTNNRGLEVPNLLFLKCTFTYFKLYEINNGTLYGHPGVEGMLVWRVFLLETEITLSSQQLSRDEVFVNGKLEKCNKLFKLFCQGRFVNLCRHLAWQTFLYLWSEYTKIWFGFSRSL